MSNGFFYLVDSYVFFSGDLSVQVRLAHPSAHSSSDPSPGRGSGTPVFKAGGMSADAYRGQVSFLPRQLRGSKIFPVLVRSISVSSSVFSVHLHFRLYGTLCAAFCGHVEPVRLPAVMQQKVSGFDCFYYKQKCSRISLYPPPF